MMEMIYKTCDRLYTGIIPMGAQGSGTPLAKITVHCGGRVLSTSKFLYELCFSKCIDLASEVFSTAMMNFALLHGY